MTPRSALWSVAAALTLASAFLLEARRDTRDAIAAQLGDSAQLADSIAAASLTAEVDRVRLSLERARAVPERAAPLHLTLAVGTGTLALERGDVVLRSVAVDGTLPRGVHTVRRVVVDLIELEAGLRLRARGEGWKDDGAPGTLWLSARDFEAISGAVGRGTRCHVY